jgi:hypothetical protein
MQLEEQNAKEKDESDEKDQADKTPVQAGTQHSTADVQQAESAQSVAGSSDMPEDKQVSNFGLTSNFVYFLVLLLHEFHCRQEYVFAFLCIFMICRKNPENIASVFSSDSLSIVVIKFFQLLNMDIAFPPNLSTCSKL